MMDFNSIDLRIDLFSFVKTLSRLERCVYDNRICLWLSYDKVIQICNNGLVDRNDVTKVLRRIIKKAQKFFEVDE